MMSLVGRVLALAIAAYLVLYVMFGDTAWIFSAAERQKRRAIRRARREMRHMRRIHR